MRKFENVDVIAVLGAVVECNTEHYKSDFKYDIKAFKESVENPDSEGKRFLWLSRRSGTWCVSERETYLKNTAAFTIWNNCANIIGENCVNPMVIVPDRIHAFAVEIKGLNNGRIIGDLHEIDYREHIRHLIKTVLPRHTVTAEYEDGTKLTLPHAKHDGKRERLYYQHGEIKSLKENPKDENALKNILADVRESRDKDARPAVFKIRIKAPKQQSIKQKLAAGKKQLAADRAAAPYRTAGKNKKTGLEELS